MKKLLLFVAVIGVMFMFSNESFAQRKAVSGKEVTGTFETSDGANIVKVLSFKKNEDGNNLQVELYASLKLGRNGDEPRGNLGWVSGFAQLEGDTVIFTPDGMESDECTITMKFVKLGVLNIKQEGVCGFINDIITTAGKYTKKSSAKPTFTED